MRKLATTRTIAKVSTHANADRLAVYTVDGWQVMKLDGSSMTLFCNKGEIGGCSRNWELLENMDNSLWRAAHTNGLLDKLKQLGRNLAIQGELIGLSIQKNIYRLNAIKLMVFRILDINNREFLPREEMIALCQQLGVDTVPLLQNDLKLPDTMHEAIISADGSSGLHDTGREGLVCYAHENSSVHFKIISNQFLQRTAG